MSTFKNDLIKLNKYTRPGKKLNGVKKIVLHWTGNKGATDENHHDYFEDLDSRYASAHIFVDKDSATCIIPLNEVAYHANDNYEKKNGIVFRGMKEISPNANLYTIGIEMCVENDGTIHPNTIKRTVEVAVELCKIYKLTEKDIIRHYDVTHKPCPKPFVDHPEQFENFKKQVKTLLESKKVEVKLQPFPGTIKLGDKGETVIMIQKKVGVKADGIFGLITAEAVKEFQRKNGLVADSLVGKKTWSKLF